MKTYIPGTLVRATIACACGTIFTQLDKMISAKIARINNPINKPILHFLLMSADN